MLTRIAVVLLFFVGLSGARALAQTNEPVVYVFWAESCPYSQRAMTFINHLRRTEPGMKIQDYEVDKNPSNARAQERVLARIGIIGASFVPLIVVGENVHIGFENDETSGRNILGFVQKCRVEGCPDRISDLLPADAPGWAAATLAPVRPVCTRRGETYNIKTLVK
jgi:glutaredoxin